jgi:hypothetical protein
MRRISALALVLLTGLVAAQLPHALAGSHHPITTFDVPPFWPKIRWSADMAIEVMLLVSACSRLHR